MSVLQDKVVTPRVQEKLCENEARVKILTEEWAERWREAHSILEVRSLIIYSSSVPENVFRKNEETISIFYKYSDKKVSK